MRQRVLSTLRSELTWRHMTQVVAFVAVAAFGAWIGLALGAERSDQVGPLIVTSEVTFSLTGDTVVNVPPLGTIELDTHDGPLALHAQVESLDNDVTQDALAGTSGVTNLDQVPGEVRDLLIRSYLQALVVAVAGATLAVLVVWRRPRWAAITAAGVAAALVVGAGAGAATWNNRALAQPHYTGLLVFVPQVVGDADMIVSNFEEYGQQLGGLVENVAQLATAARSLPTLEGSPGTIRALHVSDIHLNPNVWPIVRSIIEQYDIDVVLDTGDIADHGTGAENSLLKPIESLGIPYVFIRGNHDSSATAAAIAAMDNTYVLDNEIVDVGGLVIAGAGDPRFTPDKSTDPTDEAVVASGEGLDQVIQASGEPIDVAMVHDPLAADPLAGDVPLVLAGHLHERDERDLGGGTELLIQGSTGGAGLRALETEDPTPLTFTVLYFDRVTQQLTARDEFTLGGLGAASAEVERILEDRSTP
ncbi:MAG: metallophosphoesterase [Actinomycetia bacterium]|nr:metallophosphoesterase [Actinomycetes bacterium]